MSEEGDSWFKSAFGVDLGEAAGKVVEEVTSAVAQVPPGALVDQVAPVVVPPAPPIIPPAPPIVPPTPVVPPPVPVAPLAEQGAKTIMEEIAADVAAAGRAAATQPAAGVGIVGGAVGLGAFAAGLAAPFVVGYMLQRGEELDNQADPDEQKLPGGLPDNKATEPDGGAPAVAPGTPTTPSGDPGNPEPAQAPSGEPDDPAVLGAFEQDISDHTKKVTNAETDVGRLEKSLDDELATVAKDEEMLAQLEEQKRRGTFDPRIGAFQGRVQKDFNLTRTAGTSTSDVEAERRKVNQLSDENLAIRTKIEIERDVNQSISGVQASRFDNSAQSQSKRLSTLNAKLDTAKDRAIDLQARNDKVGERLKGL